MVPISVYFLGLLFIIILGGFISAIIEIGRNDYRRNVRAEDIEKLNRIFRE